MNQEEAWDQSIQKFSEMRMSAGSAMREEVFQASGLQLEEDFRKWYFGYLIAVFGRDVAEAKYDVAEDKNVINDILSGYDQRGSHYVNSLVYAIYALIAIGERKYDDARTFIAKVADEKTRNKISRMPGCLRLLLLRLQWGTQDNLDLCIQYYPYYMAVFAGSQMDIAAHFCRVLESHSPQDQLFVEAVLNDGMRSYESAETFTVLGLGSEKTITVPIREFATRVSHEYTILSRAAMAALDYFVTVPGPNTDDIDTEGRVNQPLIPNPISWEILDLALRQICDLHFIRSAYYSNLVRYLLTVQNVQDRNGNLHPTFAQDAREMLYQCYFYPRPTLPISETIIESLTIEPAPRPSVSKSHPPRGRRSKSRR